MSIYSELHPEIVSVDKALSPGNMTATIIILTSCLAVFILAIRAAVKYRNKGESKLSAYEHPSTFKKPEIEMVNSVPQKQNDSSIATTISLVHFKDKTVTD